MVSNFRKNVGFIFLIVVGVTFFCLTSGFWSIWQKSPEPTASIFSEIWMWLTHKFFLARAITLQFWHSVMIWIQENFSQIQNQQSVWWQMVVAFLAGLSVSLTPCIYPLMPVTIGILSSNHKVGVLAMISRSIFYLLGQSAVFTILALLAIKFNLLFGSWLANPWLIGLVVIFFVILALSLFDVFEFDFLFIQTQTPIVSGIFSAFVFGAVSGIVTSPCMTPALLTLLGMISKQGDQLIGFALLFSFAVGMNFLILLLSMFSSSIFYLPRPGSWMLEFKKILGFGILLLCINFLDPFLTPWKKAFLQGLLALVMAIYYYFDSKKDTVTRMIRAHKKMDVDVERDLHLWEYVTPLILIKKIAAIGCLGFGIFLFGKSYLLFKKTRLFTVLLKILR